MHYGSVAESTGEKLCSILAIIVLYGMAPSDSVTLTSLARALKAPCASKLRLKVLLFDNSLEAHTPPEMFGEQVYLPVADNRGLAEAYNVGLRMAEEQGYSWLLTLDQDTSLPEDFLSTVSDRIALVDGDNQIAAVVPKLQGHGRTLSPYRFRWGALPTRFEPSYSGVPNDAVYALNSASLMRVKALRQVGGYDPRFWLDASDHAIFCLLADFGKRVYVDSNIEVQHRLSLLGGKESMSAVRYEGLLAAESAFWDLRMNMLANWERNARLLVRLIRQIRSGDKKLQSISWKHLVRRLLHSRRYRLRLWEQAVASRLGTTFADRTLSPMVSVCMASYNGERHIEEQIRSILPQLGEADELIVVDDASSDRTRDRILGIDDPRISLIRQPENRGVVETFEHAVRSATGDILFLSDGDDIWAPNKVEKVLRAFDENPGARVVCTGLRLIGENGQPMDSTDYMKGREFTASILPNLLRNRFQGSVMAFRSSLLSQILPFPKRRKFLHDAWIGMRNTMTGGATVYLAEPLLYYRRYSNNFSKRMGLKARLMTRTQLTTALVARWIRSH
jgi:GT2 family glycosyltransferase